MKKIVLYTIVSSLMNPSSCPHNAYHKFSVNVKILNYLFECPLWLVEWLCVFSHSFFPRSSLQDSQVTVYTPSAFINIYTQQTTNLQHNSIFSSPLPAWKVQICSLLYFSKNIAFIKRLKINISSMTKYTTTT